jgi:hypothetical protein
MGYLGNAPYQGVLTGGNIQDGTVETTDLADQSVTTTKLHDQSVTAGKLHTVLDLSGKTLTLPAAAVQAHAPVSSVNGRTGAVVVGSGDVTGALGYMPVNKAGDTMTGNFAVSGRVRMQRSEYAWYQYGGNPSDRYLHIKTNLWCGGAPHGDIQPTMSLFNITGYTYDAQSIDSSIGFHNWVGNLYSVSLNNRGSRSAAANVYKSSDGYVVLVVDTGTNYPGITIDYHQVYPYTRVDITATASKFTTGTSGGY